MQRCWSRGRRAYVLPVRPNRERAMGPNVRSGGERSDRTRYRRPVRRIQTGPRFPVSNDLLVQGLTSRLTAIPREGTTISGSTQPTPRVEARGSKTESGTTDNVSSETYRGVGRRSRVARRGGRRGASTAVEGPKTNSMRIDARWATGHRESLTSRWSTPGLRFVCPLCIAFLGRVTEGHRSLESVEKTVRGCHMSDLRLTLVSVVINPSLSLFRTQRRCVGFL
jgi:hypothetical protein